MEPTNEISIIASASDQGKRADKFLAQHTHLELSRMRLQALMRQGAVCCNGAIESNLRAKIKAGDRFTIKLTQPEPSAVKAQNIPLDILFEDEDVIVINKAAGLAVHPDSVHRDGTLVNALLYHCGQALSAIGGAQRAGIVHRLDMHTSGLLVCAKTASAHLRLAEQFVHHGRDGKLSRVYLALVWGKPPPGPEIIDAPIGRHPIARRKMAVRKFGGREAQTEFRLAERIGDSASLLRCSLFTGRTHQIRVHLLSRGWSVIGDPIYHLRKNKAHQLIKRQALHATHLRFIHPRSNKPLSFDSPLPEDMLYAIKKLKQNMLV